MEGDLGKPFTTSPRPTPCHPEVYGGLEFIPQRSTSTIRSCCSCRSHRSPLSHLVRFPPTDPHTWASKNGRGMGSPNVVHPHRHGVAREHSAAVNRNEEISDVLMWTGVPAASLREQKRTAQPWHRALPVVLKREKSGAHTHSQIHAGSVCVCMGVHALCTEIFPYVRAYTHALSHA